MDKNKEYEYSGLLINGFAMIVITFVIIPALVLFFLLNDSFSEGVKVVTTVIGVILFLTGCVGYFTQEPNEARVMIFFGTYKGPCRKVGFFWANPFMTRRKLSLRIRNMDIEPIKVNDKVGNPVLIGMVLVWRIKDTYRAVFDLDSASLGATGTTVSNAALQNFRATLLCAK